MDVYRNPSVVICELAAGNNEWPNNLKEDNDYKEILKETEHENDHVDVKLPRCSRKFLVADFFIDTGELKMILENCSIKVVPKSKRREVFNEAHGGIVAGHLNAPKAHGMQAPPLRPFTTNGPYELIVVDLFVGAYAIVDKKARTVLRALFECWICEGCRWPKCIHSDQGPEFVNSTLSEVCKITGIEQSVTKGYNPREHEKTE
ncbi:unnamed protein product [Haemonchus placei]|uniref:Integrase catalytic domain-containing protein n=1 Tax=Haemonchus placei TaxID=6290 RepID=A0A0N4W9G9_HAEPC|nr:unnamed protein product [Haemonchus placei]